MGILLNHPDIFPTAHFLQSGERIDSVAAIHLQTGERRRFTAAECAFGYRQSFFKTLAGRDWLILSVRLRLFRSHEGGGRPRTGCLCPGFRIESRIASWQQRKIARGGPGAV